MDDYSSLSVCCCLIICCLFVASSSGYMMANMDTARPCMLYIGVTPPPKTETVSA